MGIQHHFIVRVMYWLVGQQLLAVHRLGQLPAQPTEPYMQYGHHVLVQHGKLAAAPKHAPHVHHVRRKHRDGHAARVLAGPVTPNVIKHGPRQMQVHIVIREH